jgi:hypothetical protein
MEFAIRHFVAGRVRLYVPALCRRRPLAEASLAWLRAQTGVKRARINYDCSSLVVEYDVAHEPLLRAIVGRLALMDLDDLRCRVMPANSRDCNVSFRAGAAHRPEASPSHSLRAPLALPTLSLLLAFSANPIVRASAPQRRGPVDARSTSRLRGGVCARP